MNPLCQWLGTSLILRGSTVLLASHAFRQLVFHLPWGEYESPRNDCVGGYCTVHVVPNLQLEFFTRNAYVHVTCIFLNLEENFSRNIYGFSEDEFVHFLLIGFS